MTEAKGILESGSNRNGKIVGQIELDDVIKDTPENAGRRAEIYALDEALRKKMSPKGALNLPPLLDERRLEWGIIDAAFGRQASFDRIFIWQIPEQKTETFGEGSLIVMTDQGKARLKNEAPRGILLSAGLKALDALRSNGIDLGHVVNFIQAAPWRIFVDYVQGHRPAILVMNAGDILGSEDLAEHLRDSELHVARKEGQHVYLDREGNYELPIQPWIGDDF